MTTDQRGKFKRLSQRNSRVSCKIITGIIIILLAILIVFLFPSLIFSQNNRMIDYKEMDVKSLTDEQMKALIGLKFSEEPTKDAEVVTYDKLPKKSRVIPYGSVVTMDYDDGRLNVHLKADGTIYKVKRG